MITFHLIDNATPAFRKLLADAKRPRALLMAAGRAVANLLKKHYREVHAANPNKLGGRRTNFWLQIMRSVSAPLLQAGDTSVVVSITHPAIAQKLKGGPIHAKRVRMLTIPVSPDAYGRTASTFEHETGLKLFLLRLKHGRGNAFLASKDSGGGLTIQYLLKSSVLQAPDPNALPGEKQMASVAIQAAEAALRRQLATT